MPYATVMHVEALNAARHSFTGSSLPSATQVVFFIEDAAGIIDGLLQQRGYDLPITDPVPSSTALTLRNANAVGAAYMVESSAQVGVKRDQFKAMWDEALKMLGDVDLAGLVKSNLRMPRQRLPAPTSIFSMDMPL